MVKALLDKQLVFEIFSYQKLRRCPNSKML